VDITLGYQSQTTDNPTLSEAARKTGNFDFQFDSKLNAVATIGNQLSFPISYNTKPVFNFENQMKLNYKGKPDQILKDIQAGNINFQTKGRLMSSMQNLFGLKTQMQFGRFTITAAVANSNSQQQSTTLQGGGESQNVRKTLDDYDENRNFLLAQYFVNTYNKSMSSLPLVNSLVQITRMEVWVTNRNGVASFGASNSARAIVGLMDLGETNPYNTNIHTISTFNGLPQNGANDVYGNLVSNTANRNPSVVQTSLNLLGLTPTNDYEQVYARLLSPSEYYFNPKIGFISLQQQLQPSDVLAVSFQYTINGKVYQVGEFSTDIALDSTTGTQQVLFLKLLKATSQRTNLPLWNLMMKNVYSLDFTSFQNTGFNLNLYYQEPSGGAKRYLPEASPAVLGVPLTTLLRADKLNSNNDPVPDGWFDFVDGYTVLAQQGKIIFPVLEPFGRDLDSLAFKGVTPDISSKYLYQPLYDSIKAIAQTYANLNHYLLLGTIKGSSTSQIQLQAGNIPQGSVKVTAGAQQLVENVDYVIDYNAKTLTIVNQGILSSGASINVQYENNNGNITSATRNFVGVRMDYNVNKNLDIGATMEKLSEQSYTTKVNYGYDPINNTMYGLDFNYKSDFPWMTQTLSKLPFYHTKAPSSINAYGEAALLQPGHSSIIGSGSNGSVYLDDFESAASSFDMRYPFSAWALASTPAGNGLFPEADLMDSVDYGKNRAKLAWYTIEPALQDVTNSGNPLRNVPNGLQNELSDPRVRPVYTNELFPLQSTQVATTQTSTFDLAYYPTDRGPYNYTSNANDIDANGKLKNPQNRWGGLMRAIDQTDFVTSNIEYVEFWVQDPFILNPQSKGGKLYLNLGSVSEDILKDGKKSYENGLPTPTQQSSVDENTVWGRVPTNPIQLTNGFSNDPTERPYQDVGLDGENDADEAIKHSQYLSQIAQAFGATSPYYKQASADPSNDNYVWYRDGSYDAANTGLLGRYKNFNNPQGNTPITGNSASTMYPDNEDLNGDNTLNTTEQYYEYEVDLHPGMTVTDKYVTDMQVVNAKLANGSTRSENWYQFRIPVTDFTENIGNVPDFRSIQYLRMYMTGFQDSTVLRFASFNLVSNTWRPFTYYLDTTASYTNLPANSPTNFVTSFVNLENNSNRQPIPYVMPPGVQRVQQLADNGAQIYQNEQSLSLKLDNLQQGDARAVFKSMNVDLRQYGTLAMFLHAESVIGAPQLQDNDLTAVIRIGQDYLSNYYEIRIPLKITPPSATATSQQVWPTENELNLTLQDLVKAKMDRNAQQLSVSSIFRETINGQEISVMGNPNIAQVQGILIGVENTNSSQPASAEIWADELRLMQINERGGWAALGRVDMQLADLGTMSVSANTYSAGWGSLDQSTNQRAMNSMVQIDASANIDAGKLLPKNAGATIPVFASINKTTLTPLYDEFDQDVKYKDKLKAATSKAAADSIKDMNLDQSTTKTINFTNVRFGQQAKGRPKIWSIRNFDFSYSYTGIDQSNPTVALNKIERQRGGFGYTFNGQPTFYQPFIRLINKKKIWLALIRDININLTPSLLSVRTDISRQTSLYIPRIVNTYGTATDVDKTDSSFDNQFTFNRLYNLRWNLTRSINIDYSATNYATVDMPYGALNTKAKKDSVKQNFWKGGRTTLYQQRAIVSYTLPFAKFPATEFINAGYSYSAGYNWIGASLIAKSLGNTIENSTAGTWNVDLSFDKIYNKIPFIKRVKAAMQKQDEATGINLDTLNKHNNNSNTNNNPKPTVDRATSDTAKMKIPSKDFFTKGKKGKEKDEALKKWSFLKQRILLARKKVKEAERKEEVSGMEKTAVQFLTMFKSGTFSYSTTYNSHIPGYMDSTRAFGMDWKTRQPGLDYVLGKQPNAAWLDAKARQGMFTHDSSFNDLIQQNYMQTIKGTLTLEPIRHLTIDINLDKTFSKNYSELFKDTLGNGNYSHLSAMANGGFSISYISFGTLFKKVNPTGASEMFQKFSSYRQIISDRLAATNGYYDQTNKPTTLDGFAAGYGRYAQDVLIPAFIAAYTGKNPQTVALVSETNASITSNPLGGIKPKPNWRLTYTGLAQMLGLSHIFSTLTITNAYSSVFSMNSFNSSLNFSDPMHLNSPSFIDTLSGNYVPFYIIPNISITESFSPLIGIDATTRSQSNFRLQYSKMRQLSLSLIDYQVSEMNSTEITMGFTWHKSNANLNFLPGNKRVGTKGNDLDVSVDFSIRNNIQTNSVLDQTSSFNTGGSKIFFISPTINYTLSRRVNLQFYFQQQRINPYISTTPPTTNTSGGLKIKVALTP
jgi:cell surface protein SprA